MSAKPKECIWVKVWEKFEKITDNCLMFKPERQSQNND
jgi:hypothetical protein